MTLVKNHKIKLLTSLILLALPIAMLVNFLSGVSAAGVSVSLSPDSIDSSTSNELTISYTATGEYAASDAISITFTPALSGAVSDCVSATDDIDGDATTDGSFGSFTTSGAIYTLSDATTTASTGGVDLCLTIPSGVTQGSYSVSFTDTNSDFGAALLYVNDDNDVTVTAEVVPTLSFNIRSLDDTTDTNVCDLGTVDTTTTPNTDGTDDGAGECGYALAIGTNASSGFQAQITADGALDNVSSSISDAAEDDAIAAGAEAYGLVNITQAATGRDGGTGNYDQNITEDGDFADDADYTPVPTTPTNFVSYTDGIQYVSGTDALDTTRVMHGVTVGAGTPAGLYQQLVTYTVTVTY
jgi:hypothetical protein